RLDSRSFAIMAIFQVPLNASTDLRVDRAVGRSDPLRVDRHITLHWVYHYDFWRRRRRGRGLRLRSPLTPPGKEKQGNSARNAESLKKRCEKYGTKPEGSHEHCPPKEPISEYKG